MSQSLKTVNDTLFRQAKVLRMCKEVHNMWYGKILSVDELFDLYYANLDFCVEYRWPSPETLKELLSDDERRSHGMIADDRWSLLNTAHCVVLGDSEAKLRYNGFAVARATITGNSKCEITAKGHAHLTLCVYDNASVNLDVSDKARVVILRYSKNCTLSYVGKATVKECF